MENNSCCCSCSRPDKNVKFPTVDVEVFAEDIKKPDVYLIDVRTPDEYATGHIEGAHNIDVNNDDFMEVAAKTLPKDKKIAVYCGTGKRSAKASGELASAGYEIINLDGGLNAWTAAGKPIVK